MPDGNESGILSLAERLVEALRTAPGVPAAILKPQFRPEIRQWAAVEAKAAELRASAAMDPRHLKARRQSEEEAARLARKLGLPAESRAEILRAVARY